MKSREPEKLGDVKAAGRNRRAAKVNFVQIRSFWHVFRSFDRMWSFFILYLQSYVVYLGDHSHSFEVSPTDLNQVRDTHYEFLGSCLGSKDKAKDAIFYSYMRHTNGFAAILEDEKAAQIAKHPKVVSVFLNRGRKLHTTRSWDFMGLEDNGVIPSSSIWKKARYGENTIIGNLDTDIVAMAARDAVAISHGPVYEVETGRKDGSVNEEDCGQGGY